MLRNRKLSRALQDAGRDQFITLLGYKCERTGKTLIKEIGLADLLGPSNGVKSSHGARAVSAADPSKGVQLAEHGSQDEAPTRIALAI